MQLTQYCIKIKFVFIFRGLHALADYFFLVLSLILGVVEVKIGRGENITSVIVIYRKNTFWANVIEVYRKNTILGKLFH